MSGNDKPPFGIPRIIDLLEKPLLNKLIKNNEKIDGASESEIYEISDERYNK